MSKKMLFIGLWLSLGSCWLMATTLTTNLAEVHLENLPIGGVYDVGQIASMPFWVGYSGEGQITVKIVPLVPGQQELRSGYEPLPDVNWLRLDKETLTINAGEQAPLNLLVSIPYDEKYRGKSYQGIVLIQSVGMPSSGLGIGLGIKGKVFLKIADNLPDKSNLGKKRQSNLARGVIVIPDKVYLDDIPKDRPVDLRSLTGEQIKILNATEEPVKITGSIVEPEKFGIVYPGEYQRLTDQTTIKVFPEKMTIKPDGVKNLNVRVHLPKDIPGSKFFGVIKLRIESKKLEIDKFVNVYITTK